MIFDLPRELTAPTILLILSHISVFFFGGAAVLILHGDLFGFRRMK